MVPYTTIGQFLGTLKGDLLSRFALGSGYEVSRFFQAADVKFGQTNLLPWQLSQQYLAWASNKSP